MPTAHVNPAVSAVPPWAVQKRIGTTAARYAHNSVLMPRTDSGLTYIDYRSGVMASGDGGNTHLAMRVTAGTGMQVQVAQGNCVINTPNQGAYMCCLDSVKTLTIPASSTTTSRYDLVVAAVYDDNNTAIAGDYDVRQFTVELVKGDDSTGTPVVPSAPVGTIPLASVYVGKGASNLTGTDPNQPTGSNAVIQDLRGEGLVARGGMRGLYGKNSIPGSAEFERPGAYPGDQRYVHNAVFQHQVYYGHSDTSGKGGWRGVFNCLVYNSNPAPGERFWVRGTGNTAEVCRVSIPYPGTPFMVYPTGRAATIISPATIATLRTSLVSKDGALINWHSQQNAFVVDSTAYLGVAPVMWGPFTDAVDVVLSLEVTATDNPERGVSFRGYDTGANLLTVNAFPSTVPPPGA